MKNVKAGSPVAAEPHAEMKAKMKSVEFSAGRLAEMYLGRIREADSKLRSVFETNPDALKSAEGTNKERELSKMRSPQSDFKRRG